MRLEQINILLRPRNPWEALDLGRAMLHAWHRDALKAWGLAYLASGLLLLALLWRHQAVAIGLIWWLKPLGDRALLFAFSRSVFGKRTTLRDVLHALPALLRHSGLLAALTFRRFSLARAFLLPVAQLEGQRGRPLRQRCRLLAARVHSHAAGLTAFCANMSFVLTVSLLILTETLTPQGREGLFSLAQLFGGNLSAAAHFALNCLYMAAETIVEPFYVASGFALYLNRRSELEGWDIELAFRQLSARKAGG